MISPRAARLVASIHKWLGLIIGAQLIVWTATGLYFASIPIEQIRGEHYWDAVDHGAIDLSRVKLSALDAAKVVVEDQPKFIRLRSFLGDPVYEIRADIGFFMVSAETGGVRSPLTYEDASEVVIAATGGLGRPANPFPSLGLEENASLITENPPHEYAGPIPAWVFEYSGGGHNKLYLDALTGETIVVRTDVWRTYDFLWSLHIMDWGPARENFNTPWLVAAAVFALSTVLFGVVLLVHRFTRGVLREKKETP
ncbi:MAG TPA: hypothetical protein VIA80_03030 [Hyphomonadaceae bacterium]